MLSKLAWTAKIFYTSRLINSEYSITLLFLSYLTILVKNKVIGSSSLVTIRSIIANWSLENISVGSLFLAAIEGIDINDLASR